MKRKLTVLLAVALVPVFGTVACATVEDELRDRAKEEVDKQRQRAEDRVSEEATQLLEDGK